MNKSMMLIAALCATAGCALAQETKPIGVSIKIGQIEPQGRAAREEGKRWVIVGADMKVKDMKYDGKGKGEYLTASVDFYSKGDFSSIPLMLNYVVRQNEWYFLAGAGVAFTQDSRVFGSDTITDEAIELAFGIGVGYDFQNWKSPLFAEARYMGNGNDRLSGFAVSIGVRL